LVGAFDSTPMMRAKVIDSLKWLGSAKLLSHAVSTVVLIIVIRLLEPADYGLMAMAAVFLGLILLFNEMGLGSALIQKAELVRGELEQVFGILLVVNLALYTLVYLSAPFIAAFFDEPRLTVIIQVLGLRLPLISLLVVPRAMLRREMRFRAKAIVDLIGILAASATTLVLAFLGLGVWALVWGALMGALAEVVAVYVVWRMWVKPNFSLKGMRYHLVFGGYLTLDHVLWYVYTQADTVVIGRMIGNEALGLYYIARRIASMPLDMIGGITQEVGFSAYSRVQQDRAQLASYYSKVAKIGSFYSFPVCFGIAAIAPQAVPIVLGDQWVGATLPMQILALTIPLQQLNALNTPALFGIGRPDVNVGNLMIAIVMMPAAFVFGSRWGVTGVAFAWLLAYPFYFAIVLLRSLPVLMVPFRSFFDAVWPSALSAVLMLVVVALGQFSLQELGAGPVVVLLASILIGAVAYVTTIWVMRKELLAEVLSLVRR
jgi:teichuronic acid exporter